MHPGEKQIRAESLSAITDHFASAVLPMESGNFTFDWRPSGLPGSDALAVLDVHDTEVARYAISITVTKVGVPKVKAPDPEPDPEPEPDVLVGKFCPNMEEPDCEVYPLPGTNLCVTCTPPTEGMWGNVVTGCRVIDPSGKRWNVRRDGTEVTISHADKSHTFTPGPTEPVRYLPPFPLRSEPV